MPDSSFSIMSVFACLLASLAPASPARAQCMAARTVGRTDTLSEAWRAAVDELIRSTAEPAHPWSCGGGTIGLVLDADGGALSIAREGAESVTRRVGSPEDVVPLGEALLSTPLAATADTPAPAQAPATLDDRAKPEPASRAVAAPSTPPSAAAATEAHARRLLLSGGVDLRGVGGSSVGWIGPTLSAGLMMGLWLPSVSLRQQSAFTADGPSIDELSVALAFQRLFELSPFELRAGLSLRGAVVARDLPRPSGEQSRVEGRVGAVVGFAIPVLSWANLVLAVDADVVAFSSRATVTDTSSDEAEAPRFPTYTVGGSVCFEVSL